MFFHILFSGKPITSGGGWGPLWCLRNQGGPSSVLRLPSGAHPGPPPAQGSRPCSMPPQPTEASALPQALA